MQALRRDLRALEEDAKSLAAELEEATDWNPGSGFLQQLEGRFRCLAGMYKAHSQVGPENPHIRHFLSRFSGWDSMCQGPLACSWHFRGIYAPA